MIRKGQGVTNIHMVFSLHISYILYNEESNYVNGLRFGSDHVTGKWVEAQNYGRS